MYANSLSQRVRDDELNKKGIYEKTTKEIGDEEELKTLIKGFQEKVDIDNKIKVVCAWFRKTWCLLGWKDWSTVIEKVDSSCKTL